MIWRKNEVMRKEKMSFMKWARVRTAAKAALEPERKRMEHKQDIIYRYLDRKVD